MAVVINEFEVVTDTAGRAASEGTAPRGTTSGGEGPTPRDIVRVMQRAHDRALRVRAD
jgi:hypothetical protein